MQEYKSKQTTFSLSRKTNSIRHTAHCYSFGSPDEPEEEEREEVPNHGSGSGLPSLGLDVDRRERSNFPDAASGVRLESCHSSLAIQSVGALERRLCCACACNSGKDSLAAREVEVLPQRKRYQ